MSETSTDKIKLLIVDDEREFLEALGQRLEMRDFDVHLATAGAEAVDLCRKEKFDLALVDLKMPGMDGQELLARLKAEHTYLEVIILTGHGSLGNAVECAKMGAYSYLPKPYKLEELLDVLKGAYLERMRKKFEADGNRIRQLIDLAQGESALGIMRRMRDLDDERK